MIDNIKFESVDQFVNYPHNEIVSSKGFSKHDAPSLPIDHRGNLEILIREILIDDIRNLSDAIASKTSDTPDLDVQILAEYLTASKALNSGDWKLYDFDEIRHYNTKLHSELMEEEFRIHSEENNSNHENGDEYIRESHLVTKIGNDTYELSILDERDLEKTQYHEEWKKNGEPHRYGGGPAETKRLLHNIPEEKHMNESYKSYCIDGREVKHENCLSPNQEREVDIHSMLGLGSNKEQLEQDFEM